MRTTLTLNDELAAMIEAERKKTGMTMKETINQLLEEGLRGSKQRPKPRRFRTKPVRMGLRAGIDSTKLNQLIDELDAEEYTESG